MIDSTVIYWVFEGYIVKTKFYSYFCMGISITSSDTLKE